MGPPRWTLHPLDFPSGSWATFPTCGTVPYTLFLFWGTPHSLTHTQSWQAGTISGSPSTWLTLFSSPWCFLRSHPTQLVGPPKLFPMAFPYKWPILVHASYFPKISQKDSIWRQHALYLSLTGPRPRTSGSQPWFTVWLRLDTPSAAQVAAICRLLCTSCCVALHRTQAKADAALCLLGGSRASIHSG